MLSVYKPGAIKALMRALTLKDSGKLRFNKSLKVVEPGILKRKPQ